MPQDRLAVDSTTICRPKIKIIGKVLSTPSPALSSSRRSCSKRKGMREKGTQLRTKSAEFRNKISSAAKEDLFLFFIHSLRVQKLRLTGTSDVEVHVAERDFPLVWSLTHPGIDPEPRKSHVECRAKRCFCWERARERACLVIRQGCRPSLVLCNVDGLV